MIHHYTSPLRSIFCAVTAFMLIAGPLQAADNAMPKDRTGLDKAIHDYVMSHPEIVVEALKAAQQNADSQSAEQSRRIIAEKKKAIFDNPDDLVLGNPKGDITVVEFFDYRCPYCKQIEPALDALLQEDPKLRIVYKEFPILGAPSVFASRVALAAKKQGKYPALHRALMAMKGDITDETVLKLASAQGLNIETLKADISTPDVERVINANYELADALKIEGTPALIIGDTLIPGAVDLDALRKNIAELRKRG